MNLQLDELREKANNLPLLPGVYIMLDEHSEVIYVGKAKKYTTSTSSSLAASSRRWCLKTRS